MLTTRSRRQGFVKCSSRNSILAATNDPSAEDSRHESNAKGDEGAAGNGCGQSLIGETVSLR